MKLALLLWTTLAFTIPSVALYTEIGSSGDQNVNENRPLLYDLEREEQRQKQRRAVHQFPAESPLAKFQIIQDSRRLQLLNAQVRESAAQQGGQNKSLIKPLEEMRKRATRLESNLALKGSDVKKSEPIVNSDLASLLSELDQSVNSLVQNPMLRNTQVIDVNLAKKATVDLEAVIELTKVISTRIDKGPR